MLGQALTLHQTRTEEFHPLPAVCNSVIVTLTTEPPAHFSEQLSPLVSCTLNSPYPQSLCSKTNECPPIFCLTIPPLDTPTSMPAFRGLYSQKFFLLGQFISKFSLLPAGGLHWLPLLSKFNSLGPDFLERDMRPVVSTLRGCHDEKPLPRQPEIW